MHCILRSSLNFFENGLQPERKLMSLISAFAEMVPYLQDSSDAWKTITICASIIFKLPCPHAGLLLIDSIIAPLLQKVQFTKSCRSCFNTTVLDVLICNLKMPTEQFRFLHPDSVFGILNLIVEKVIADKTTHWRWRDLFKVHQIPLENTVVVVHFYGVLFSKSDFLESVYEHYAEQLSSGLKNIYTNIYVNRLSELSTKSCEAVDAIRSTVAKLFYHTALISNDIIIDMLSLNPLTNLLHSMRSRRGGAVPSHKVRLDALLELCRDICIYAQTCPTPLLDTVKDKWMSHLSSIPLNDALSPLLPFILDEAGPLYPDIVTKVESGDKSAYTVCLLIPPTPINNQRDNAFQYQGKQLYESIMGQYSSLMYSYPFPTLTNTPQILFSARSPEGAPLGLFSAAILGEARPFTS